MRVPSWIYHLCMRAIINYHVVQDNLVQRDLIRDGKLAGTTPAYLYGWSIQEAWDYYGKKVQQAEQQRVVAKISSSSKPLSWRV